MNKKIIGVLVVVLVIVFGLSFNQNDRINTNTVFHITLANPDLYKNGVYLDSFSIDKGEYLFKFVPNGDSPNYLTIKLKGESYDFSEKFTLRGTAHFTGMSEYYTWNYDGQNKISIPTRQDVVIEINPNGNELGSVSVDLIKI